MTVAVCHPQVQHSHQVAWALADAGLLDSFYTSCFFEPSRLKLLPKSIRIELGKRYHSNIPSSQVVTFPYYDVVWKLSGKVVGTALHERLFYNNVWQFDSFMSKQIANSKAKIVVGYENSCREIFNKSRRSGKVCVLDAASVHYQTQRNVYLPPYPEAFLEKVNARKEAEIQFADHILTLSSYAKETYVQAGVPENKISVLPLGTDIGQIAVKKKKTGCSFKYLFVGNVKLSKGIDLLVEAFEQLNVPEKHLIIIGAMGDAEPFLRRCGPNITVKGHLPHDALREEYANADVFVLPSRLDGFGMVVTEAMSAATPVIVSSHVGAKDLVKDGENGWIFESGSISALAAVMQEAYDKSDRLAAIGEKGLGVVSLYTWATYRDSIRKFYSGILEGLS